MGGWDASNYEKVMTSGMHGPVVVAGNTAKSLLAQKILGTQEDGLPVPTSGKLSESKIQIIIDWINARAPEN